MVYSELGGRDIETVLFLSADQKSDQVFLLLRFIQQFQLFFFGCFIILSNFNQFILLGSLCWNTRNKTDQKWAIWINQKEHVFKCHLLAAWSSGQKRRWLALFHTEQLQGAVSFLSILMYASILEALAYSKGHCKQPQLDAEDRLFGCYHWWPCL